MSIDLEQLNKFSIIKGYKDKIERLKSELNCVFNNTTHAGKFNDFEKSIIKSQEILEDMFVILKALQELESGNT